MKLFFAMMSIMCFAFVIDVLAENHQRHQQPYDRHIGLIENEKLKNVTKKSNAMNATRSSMDDLVPGRQPDNGQGRTHVNGSEVGTGGEGNRVVSDPADEASLRPRNDGFVNPIYIASSDVTLVHNGSCRKGCRPDDAVLTSSFQAWTEGPMDTGNCYNVSVKSMNKNIVQSISLFQASQPMIDSETSTSDIHVVCLPHSSKNVSAYFRLALKCRGTGIALAHLRFESFVSSPAFPAHIFVKAVCAVAVPPCDGVDCGLHGLCAGNRTCSCEEGYVGKRCENKIEQSNSNDEVDVGKNRCKHLDYCSGHGQCIDNEVCACSPGWTGTTCMESAIDDIVCSTLHFCSSHGQCSKIDDGHYGCSCDDGYEGEDCGTVTHNICPSDCSGRGSCIKGKCECHLGFEGDDCSTVTSPCGLCLMGECLKDSKSNTPVCKCYDEWTGSNCDKYVPEKDPCASTGFCGGQGTCSSSLSSCVCLPGFDGTTCNIVVEQGCKKGCNGFGKCDISSDKCVCNEGRRGMACEKSECLDKGNSSFACAGHGICRNSTSDLDRKGPTCLCSSTYFGPACQNANCNATMHCSGHGTCKKSAGLSSDLCKCENGWTGESCSTATVANKEAPNPSSTTDNEENDLFEDSEFELN